MTSNEKIKKTNHWRRNRTAYAVILFFILLLSFVFGLGFYYKSKGTIYDETILGFKVANLNYITGSGDIQRVSTPFMEGLLSTTIDVNDADDDDPDYLQSNAYAYAKLNEAAQVNEELQSTLDDVNEFLAPIEYNVYDDSLTNSYTYSPSGAEYYRLAAASEIDTNEDFTMFRFKLKDTKWSTGEQVTAKDFVFGLVKQLTPSNASALSYLIWDYSGLYGIDQCYASYSDPDLETSTSDLFYGMTDTCISMFREVDSVDEMNNLTKNIESGALSENEIPAVIYYDGNEGSYIQFNIEQSNEIFASMTASAPYWPVNFEWWGDALGYDANAYKFGYGKNSFSSNGPFSLTYFSSAYGITAEKNENYYDADLVTIDDFQYRVISEPSTQVSVFNNNYASYIQASDSNSKSIADNDEIQSSVRNQFTSPTTRYLAFNMHKDNQSEAMKYYDDPNFRRAIYYSFDRTSYEALAGLNNTAPTTIMTPSRMMTYDDNGEIIDYVDLATSVSYTVDSSETSGEQLQLEYFDLDERTDILTKAGRQAKDIVDPNLNIALANYYWTQFESDMEQLNLEVPTAKNPLELSFLTLNGDKDPAVKALQESLQNEQLIFANAIKVIPDSQQSGAYWSMYYQSTGWDITSLKWSPDFLDPWATLSILNSISPTRAANTSAYWTVWTGSDYAFYDDQYEDPELARELFNDGFSAFYDGTTNLSNITSPYVQNQQAAIDFMNTVVATAINDNGGNINGNNPTQIENYFANGGKVDEGLDKNNHFELFDNQDKKAAIYVMFDLLAKDSAALIPISNETSSSAPSKLYLLGNPIIGYPILTLSFDYTHIDSKSFWNEVL